MEYTRFPGAADEPPRADALRGLIEASSPPGVSHIPFAGMGFHSKRIRPSHFHKCFTYHNTNHRIDYRSLSRSTVTLIGTEGGDSCGNSMSLKTPECEAHGGSSHARGKRPPAVEINSSSTQIDWIFRLILNYKVDSPT